MGIIKSDVFNFDADTNYTVTIKFDHSGFYINNILITRNEFVSVEPGKTPETPNNPSGIGDDVWTYPDYSMRHFQSIIPVMQVGSMEGNTRCWAVYYYIMYHKKL